ncbi:MAG: DNA primase [Chloroflexi bacterium]|nr:DNA primase [Chloroflexota bacterium]
MSDISEVKQRLDIVAVASGYLPLQRSGRNFKALCPFHTEKTPSFYIFPEQQSWHCFGCGSGGDVLSLVMKKENLDFGAALRLLADKAGVTLTREKEKASQRQPIFELNQSAVEFYHRALLESPEAGIARSYLEKRGIGKQSIADFQLGYSPRSGRALTEHLRGKGGTAQDILAAGLARDEGKLDLFRGRLMFPIRDSQGRATGFGARELDGSQPKYLNSPQTAIFDKGGSLYGLDKALPAIRGKREAVVVEGYFDVIAAHQGEFKNVVASMGTAITPRQVALLKGATRSLVLALDADAAGNEAVLRGIQTARQALERTQLPVPDFLGASERLQAEIKVALLPQGQDPDEVINRSPQEWERLVASALPLMDYLFQTAMAGVDLSRPQVASMVVNKLLPYIREVEGPVERELYLGKLSRLTGVSERTLMQQAALLGRASRAGASPADTAFTWRDPLEEYCLYLLFHYAPQAGETSPALFLGTENRELLGQWLASGSLDAMRAGLEPALAEHLDEILGLEERPLPPNPYERAQRYRQGVASAMPLSPREAEQALAQCLSRLQERSLRHLIQAGADLEAEGSSLAAAQNLKQLFHQRTPAHKEADLHE